ncbi:MAG: conjugative transposon protein TraM [Chitinophagaceae bacterium]|nr:conjugative transposon protein TraM [Chitinophagaceae bacterium]
MKNSKNENVGFPVEEDEQKTGTDALKEDMRHKIEKLKKPVIFILMGVVFLGCMYLIFKPSSSKGKIEDIGLNDAVPQATDAELQSDKQKAYEQAMIDQRMEEKRNALTSLSDYWSDNDIDEEDSQADEDYESNVPATNHNRRNSSPTLNSYRNAQNTLTSFYDNSDYETQELRRQIEELKEQLAEKDIPPTTTVQDQLRLMEKSYEMASKYLPSNPTVQPEKPDITNSVKNITPKEHFIAFLPAKKNVVSALYREPSDSTFLANLNEIRNRNFQTTAVSEQTAQPKNSIRAIVIETKKVVGESSVQLRLLEVAKTLNSTIPVGTILTANARFGGGRLQLKVTSIELDGNIIPVDITAYDLDGQQGLYVPNSPEMNAVSEIAANMSQTAGTSIMMTRSAGQQVAGDLSRGVVQGVSGYFTKKIRTPKVTVKAGHQVFLVSKN